MKIGDVFLIEVLNELHAYQVDDISIVLPDETDKLAVVPEEDLITLITCTPYGINSHRLLVRGKRCEVPEEWLDENGLIAKEATHSSNQRVSPKIAENALIGGGIGMEIALAGSLFVVCARKAFKLVVRSRKHD